MKNFILNVYKNKKWITLGLSILYLLLFCFPLIRNSKEDGSTYQLPFILMLPKFLFSILDWISWLARDNNIPIIAIRNFAVYLTCSILMLSCFVLAIIYLVRSFKSKKFYFLPSLIFAFLTSFVSCIYAKGVRLQPTTYIFLIMLILDIVYLILEKHYKVKELIKPIASEDNSKNI